MQSTRQVSADIHHLSTKRQASVNICKYQCQGRYLLISIDNQAFQVLTRPVYAKGGFLRGERALPDYGSIDDRVVDLTAWEHYWRLDNLKINISNMNNDSLECVWWV